MIFYERGIAIGYLTCRNSLDTNIIVGQALGLARKHAKAMKTIKVMSPTIFRLVGGDNQRSKISFSNETMIMIVMTTIHQDAFPSIFSMPTLQSYKHHIFQSHQRISKFWGNICICSNNYSLIR